MYIDFLNAEKSFIFAIIGEYKNKTKKYKARNSGVVKVKHKIQGVV